MLTKDEAISLALYCHKKHKVSSTTTLQKAAARLLKYLIPLECEFTLNKYGSDCAEIRNSSSTDFYERSDYDYSGGRGSSFSLTEKGLKLAEEVIEYKLPKILAPDEIAEMRQEIGEVASMPAKQASADEHDKLLVDLEDRPRLVSRIADVYFGLFDLYEGIRKKKPKEGAEIALHGVVEYAYFLSRFIKEKRFRNIEDKGYDFEADMRDYYYLAFLERLIALLKKNMDKPDEKVLDTQYLKMKEFANNNYSFSLENKELFGIMK